MASSHSPPSLTTNALFGAMDDQSAALIVQLQLEDIATIFATSKGKRRASEALNDQEYALQLCRQDLETNMVTLTDRAMGQSIARAVQEDRHILAREAEIEATVARDHRLACELEGRTAPLAAAPAPAPAPSSLATRSSSDAAAAAAAEDEYLAKLLALYVSESEGAKLLMASAGDSSGGGEAGPGRESSSRGAKRQRTAAVDRRCEACRDEKKFFDVATLPHCRHDYCRDCLDQLFRLAMTDETLFPPRCCRQPIPVRDVRIFLTADTAREFERKRPELETPNRTYCRVQTCLAWIPPRHIHNDVGTCPACFMTTCTICKGEAHFGDCPNDEATQLLLQTADTSGWQRCYKCRRVVELNYGCNHIT